MPTERMPSPGVLIPGAMAALTAVDRAVAGAGVDGTLLALSRLRASQINGCGPCVDAGARGMRKAGETDERLFAVAAWRETPYFTDAERAALALAEAATRLADRADAVPDDIWAEAARHFNEKELAAIVLWVATTNFFNRINVTTRQPAPQDW